MISGNRVIPRMLFASIAIGLLILSAVFVVIPVYAEAQASVTTDPPAGSVIEATKAIDLKFKIRNTGNSSIVAIMIQVAAGQDDWELISADQVVTKGFSGTPSVSISGTTSYVVTLTDILLDPIAEGSITLIGMVARVKDGRPYVSTITVKVSDTTNPYVWVTAGEGSE